MLSFVVNAPKRNNNTFVTATFYLVKHIHTYLNSVTMTRVQIIPQVLSDTMHKNGTNNDIHVGLDAHKARQSIVESEEC